MPSPKELAAGLKAQEATSPNSKVMFVGQEHGKKTVLPDNVKKMAEKYGAYYEGAGGDKSDAVKYQGSWDDKASKEVKGYPKEFLYTLFTNSNVNNQKKNLTQPDKTIFDSALAAQDKWGYFKDRKFDADTLKQFLSASGMLDKSKQLATESNVKKFIDEGEGLMWPKNWEEYPNPAGKLAQKASEYRTNWLKSQKEGVYFVGSDHMKELNKPKEPAPSQLAKALAYRGEIRNTPQNSFLGGVANLLAPVSEFADRDKLPGSIPLLGGMSFADLSGLKGAQSLVNDMSYGTPPIRGASLQTAKVDPRVLDLAGVSGAMIPVGKALGKAALREGARQIETGTGIGRAALDPRMRMFAGEGAKTADHGALKVAKDMQAAGVPDEQIHAKTKWTFGFADGKPRFEIDDSAAAYRPGAVRAKVNEANQKMFDESVHARQLRNIMDEQGVGVGDAKAVFKEKFGREPMQGAGVGAKYSEAWQLKANEDEYYKRLMSGDVSGKTDEFLDHPELYKGYPDTGTMPTQITGDMGNKGFGGEFTGTSVKLNPEYAYGMESGKSIQLHELQHAIQQREGFAKGGSPKIFKESEGFNFKQLQDAAILDKTMRASNFNQLEALNRFQELFGRKPEPGAFAALERIGSGKELDIARDAAKLAVNPYESYRRLAGEAEARLTQARMNMTPAERAASYPPSMFDVPVKDQIVRYGDNVGGAMMHRPNKPSWYDNPSENPFAKGMTQGQLHDDWIARHKIPVNKEGFIDFYHASPSKLENIKAGSYLETDANKAKFYAARDRGLNPEDMKLHKVTLPKYDFEIGGFPTLRNDYKVKTEALRQQDRK